MRILHLTTFLQGGAGRAITELALAQHAGGHDVQMVVDAGGEPGYQSYPEYLERLAAVGVPVVRLDSTFKRDVARNVNAVAQLRQSVDVGTLDVVHTHAAVPSMIARLALSPVGTTPVVQTMHGWGVAKSVDQAGCDATLLGLVDRVVVPSQASAALMQQVGIARDRVAVVPYGIADDCMAVLPALPQQDAQLLTALAAQWTVVLGCVGTIGERKNQRLVVDALTRVRGLVAGCVFIGDGDAAGLSAYARAKGMSDRVAVLGYRPHAARYLRRTHACVLASRSEGQPLAVLEAFRDRVPVIAAATAELAELLDQGRFGLLFEPDNAAALASTIEEAARDWTKDVVERARQRFEMAHSLASMVAAYERIYVDAIERRTSTRSAA